MSVRTLWCVALVASAIGACFHDGPTLEADARGGNGGSSFTPDGGAPLGEGGMPEPQIPVCSGPIDTSEYLPARAAAISTDVVPTEKQVLVSELFNRFNAFCGACHVASDQGGLKVSASDFFVKVDEKVLERMKDNDPNKQMPPPPDVPWSQRKPGDPIIALANDLETWISKGRPAGGFYVPIEDGQQTYSMSQALGDTLSNIGSCLPNRALYASEQDKMLELDDLFQGLEAVPFDEMLPALPEELIGLPKTLAETDLFTFDSEVLARHGVVAFAPGYPLWSDFAGKLRHVRVPYGESIRFDAERQEFEIPPNTRFYKTFFKEVIDSNGNPRFRKIETRIIVSRPDIVNSDGTHAQTALFGAYKWDETETRAELVGAEGVGGPFRNGHPFADLVFQYVTDEVRAQEIRDTLGGDEYYNEEYEFDKAGIRRHYGIPSSQRCIECHMGNSSFALGFTPLQIHRRECSKENPETCAKGGVIEPTGPDELNQLQRLIDIGLITGIASPDEIVLLENSQGKRKPRNEHELKAQGYLLGNCAHCHNPIGFPSVTAPDIKDLLDFLPRPDGGGIFEFPLDRFSPRVKRGPKGDTPVPYITPSLRDRLPYEWTASQNYVQKFVETVMDIDPSPNGVKNVYNYEHMVAPWRSLIFRNTHTPYTYADDYAIFPHMPLNTPGYDCRAGQIMGEWMASIPAIRKRRDLDENYVPVDSTGKLQPDSESAPQEAYDREAQPYVEVKPGEEGYEDAVEKGMKRLEQWKNSSVYGKCVDTNDIVDRWVVPGIVDTPVDKEGAAEYFSADPEFDPDPYDRDGVPDHAHWVSTDLTEIRGAWAPRNTKWSDFLIEGVVPEVPPGASGAADVGLAKAFDARFLREILTKVTLSSGLRAFVEQPFPLTLWLPKEGCNFDGTPQVQDFEGANRPQWMDAEGIRPGYFQLVNNVPIPQKPPADAPVFEVTPGAIVFDMICRNCHGREADSRGPLAKTIQDMTGGVGRVANFRTGLFGPFDSPGTNRERLFGSASLAELFPPAMHPVKPATWPGEWPGNADDWGARYLAWMGLGGTEVKLPDAALALVGRSDVAGLPRTVASSKDANMLSVAVSLCTLALGTQYTHPTAPGILSEYNQSPGSHRFPIKDSMLLEEIGDAEFWLTLCSLDNPPPVRAIQKGRLFGPLYDPLSYPEGTLIANHRFEAVPHQRTPGLLPANLFPHCHQDDGTPTTLPLCPPNLRPLVAWGNETYAQDEIKRWILRGAVNAGLAVFVFVDRLSKGQEKLIRYDECELR